MLANARFGGRPVRAPDLDRMVVLHTGAVPDPVDGVSNDPQAVTVAAGIGRAFFVTPARQATRNLTYTIRPMHWRAQWNNGLHGEVRRLRPSTADDRQEPFLRPVRTLRSAPVGPWDAGTALGPTGRQSRG